MKTPAEMGYPLEIPASEMRMLITEVMARLSDYVAGQPGMEVDRSGDMTDSRLRALMEPMPAEGEELQKVLATLFDDALPESLNPASAGFMGYVPGGGLVYAAVADLITNTLNRYVGAAPVAPGFAQIESNVIRWFASMLGLPAESGGFLTSGGSLANQSAVATAREVMLGEAFANGVLYLSDQAHNCLTKSARLSGIPVSNIRVLASDAQYRMPARVLEHAIRHDRAAGLRPFFVGASAGTTNTGAIDPLTDIAAICARESLWFHVDAAYGGFFCLTGRGRTRLAGIERANSVVLDPHKTLFLPYGTGALLVRDEQTLRRTHSMHADYLPAQTGREGVMDFREISPELTRPFRGLRVWLPLKLHGTSVFRAYLDEKLDLCQWISRKLRDLPEIEILASPELSIMAFALRATDGEDLAARNARSRRLMQLINEKNRVHLTGTKLRGVFAVRIAIVVFRTHQQQLDCLLEDLVAALDEINGQDL